MVEFLAHSGIKDSLYFGPLIPPGGGGIMDPDEYEALHKSLTIEPLIAPKMMTPKKYRKMFMVALEKEAWGRSGGRVPPKRSWSVKP